MYFLTWRLRGAHRLLAPAERDLVCDVLRRRDGDGFQLAAFVVMDNHVHAVVTLKTISLERLVHSWKSVTAHELQRIHGRFGSIWRPGVECQVLKSPEELRRKVEYVVANPWKRWPFLKRYPWVWETAAEAKSDSGV